MVVYLGKATPASGSGGSGGEAVWGGITGTLSDQTDLADALSVKQETLVSGTNIKTINSQSLLGSGNLNIDSLPSQTGNNGKFLTTDGTDASWATVSATIQNQNTAVGATTPLEFWEGTSSEYNSGGGSQTYYNWQSGGSVNVTSTSISFTPKDFAYGNGKYVAVGTGGAIYSSTDGGNNWTAETSGVSVDLNGIAYGNNKFIAVGNSGTIISSSGDGSWSAETSDTTSNLTSIAYGNNVFVTGAVGRYSSGNGTWTATNLGNRGGDVTFVDGYFYSAGWGRIEEYRRYYNTYKSADGATFTFLSSPTSASEEASTNQSICGAGSCVYISANSDYYYSTDGGATWINGSYLTDVAYDGTTYYAVSGIVFKSSTDGVTWTTIQYITGNIKYLCYGNAIIGVGESGGFTILTYGSALNAYTTDENPTTSSVVYSEPNVTSALTITAVGTGTITCSDTNTYNYNSAGNQTVTQTVGEAHPDWICLIEGVGIKKGSTVIAQANATVDQTYNASSTNAQSGVAVASGISDTLGTINTQLESIIVQGD